MSSTNFCKGKKKKIQVLIISLFYKLILFEYHFKNQEITLLENLIIFFF